MFLGLHKKICALFALVLLVLAFFSIPGCGPRPVPPSQPPTPPAPTVRTIAAVVADSTGRPMIGAAVTLDDTIPPGPHSAPTNGDAYVAFDGVNRSLGPAAVHVRATGCAPYDMPVTLSTGDAADNQTIRIGTLVSVSRAIGNAPDILLPPINCVPPMPPVPTRDEILNVGLTFQGLTVQTQQFGSLPWFEAALPWLTAGDRAAVYAAKRASTAWGNGDTHALIFLPSGPALYDEPGQPYSADRFPPLDWTAGNTAIDPQFPALVAEVARAGFRSQLLFLGGDDGERGFPIAMRQLDLVAASLRSSPFGDLRPYVVPFPGFDGVFYGYTPEHIWEWGAKCRTLFVYCGIEHSTGHIPTGEGDSDWTGNGGMRAFDLVLSEFNDEQFDDTVYQIAARLLGPLYTRDPQQAADDDPGSPYGPNAGQFYLRQATARGFIKNCAFEFYEYTWVRGALLANVQRSRARFKARGYTCGG